MDQTISEVVYGGRIKNSVRLWNEQMNGNTTGGTIVASDGNTYKKVDGRLVQVVKGNPRLEKSVKYLNKKLEKDGLLNTAKATENSLAGVAKESSEFVASM